MPTAWRVFVSLKRHALARAIAQPVELQIGRQVYVGQIVLQAAFHPPHMRQDSRHSAEQPVMDGLANIASKIQRPRQGRQAAAPGYAPILRAR